MCVMNTDEKKEIMENENGRKNEKYFDIPRGQVKHLKVNKRYNKSSRDISKRDWKGSSWGEWVAGKPSKFIKMPFWKSKRP